MSEGRGNLAITGVENFRVLGVFTKKYNKWMISDKKRHEWEKGMAVGKYRVACRMIDIDHSTGNYQDTDPPTSAWSRKRIYILVDASDIEDVFGILELDS